MKSFAFANTTPSLLKVALGVAFALGFAACGNSFHPLPVQTEEFVTTGGTAPDGRAYTGIGDPAALERLKRSVAPSDSNRRLSQNLKIVAKSSGSNVEVKVENGDAQPLVFRAPLADGKANDVKPAEGDPRWSLDVKCLDRECESSEMRLHNSNSEAGWITTSRKVRLEVVGPFASKTPSAALKNALAEIEKLGEGVLTSHEVAWGASRFELKTKGICISGTALVTSEQDAPAAVTCEGPAGLHAALAGNSTRGDLLIRIADQDAWAFIRVRGAAVKPKPPVTQPTDPSEPTKPNPDRPVTVGETEKGAVIPVDVTNKITEAFEVDRTHAEIQSRIRGRWKTSVRLHSFLNRSLPKMPVVMNAFRDTGVPAEMIFIALVESRYFVCPGFPVEVSPVGAVGPWQFMPKTGEWLGLKVKPLITVAQANGKSSKRADTDDERGDLEKSTRAAGKYWKYLFGRFPSDPKLAIMAYNWGEGRVDTVLDCGNDATCLKKKLVAKSLQHRLSEIQAAGFDFWTVRDLNMAPKVSVEYVLDFVSAQFIGRNPSRYGLTVPQGEYAPKELMQICR